MSTYLVVLTFAAGFSIKQLAKMLCVFLKPTLHRLYYYNHYNHTTTKNFIFVSLLKKKKNC